MPRRKKKKEINLARVIELREANPDEPMSWAKIGKELNCTGAGCFNAYKKHLAETGQSEPKDYVAEPKPTSKPWDANYNPWAMDMLALEKQHKGFVPYFVKDDPNIIQTKLQQGYKFADIKDYGGTRDQIPGEEGKMDTKIRRRELILMELPNDLARKRKEFIDAKTDRQSSEYAANARAAADATRNITGSDPQLKDLSKTERAQFE